MKIIADTHTHTVVSHHAFSTLLEMVAAAKQKGLSAIAITDHAPAMEDGAHLWHFFGLSDLPEYIDGVRLIKGVETNIVDLSGNIDMENYALKMLEWNIASFHEPVIACGSEDEHTAAWEAIVKHPFIDVLGHSGNPKYSYDFEYIVKLCKEYDKIIEINSNSIYFRKGSKENCITIAKLCEKHGVNVVVNSDSHIALTVGAFDNALNMLDEINFPSELVVNADNERFFKVLQHRIDIKKQVNVSEGF